MNNLCRLLHLVASRGVTPLVVAFFALLYTGISFYTEEAFAMVLSLIRTNSIFLMLAAFIPINIAARLCCEMTQFCLVLRSKTNPAAVPGITFDESVDLPDPSNKERLKENLSSAGYQHRIKGDTWFAWKGFSNFPARFLFLLGALLLVLGLLLSIVSRATLRSPLVEGEPMPEALGVKGAVQKISLHERKGLILSHALAIDAVWADAGAPSKRFGLYPPGRINGIFVYPRYLGLAPMIEFEPPEGGDKLASYITLMIYPPGKEDSVEIPGSPYKIFFSMPTNESEPDPFISGRLKLHFRIVRGAEKVVEGVVPVGDAIASNGYTLRFPEAKKLVVTDFVKDSGLLVVWYGGLLVAAALLFYLPVRMLAPRREMLFVFHDGRVQVFSRAEGRSAGHRRVFHSILDSFGTGGNDEG